MPSARQLPVVFVAALALTCSARSERWAEVRFQEISFTNLYHAVADMLDAEGYAVQLRNPGEGLIESEWQYGTSMREVRGPSRRKAFVNIERGDDGLWLVRVRVAEEVIRKGGMMAANLRERTDWEEFPDNYDEAELLAAKIRALLSEKAVRDPQVVVPVEDDA